MTVEGDKLRDDLSQHVKECVAVRIENKHDFAELKEGHKAIIARLDGINSTAWKAVGAVGLVVLTVGFGSFLNSVFLAKNAPTKDDLIAHTSARYTSFDAAKDKASQQRVNHAIFVCISHPSKCKEPASDDPDGP